MGAEHGRGSFLPYLEFLYILHFMSVTLLVPPSFLPLYSKFYDCLNPSLLCPSIKNALAFPFLRF